MDGNALLSSFLNALVSYLLAMIDVSAVRMGEQPAFAAPDHVVDAGTDRVALVATAGQLLRVPSKGPTLISTCITCSLSAV